MRLCHPRVQSRACTDSFDVSGGYGFTNTRMHQGMVARTELLAAQSDAKAKQDEIDAKVKDLHYMEGQLSKAQEQINSARQETAQLRADMSCMVQRSELEGTKELLSNLEAAAAIESQKHREAIAALNARIGSLELEKSDRDNTIKVRSAQPASPLLT